MPRLLNTVLKSIIAVVVSISSNLSEADDLSVTNHQPDSTVRYPVVLLRGTLPDDVRQLQVANKNATPDTPDVVPAVSKGRFKALVTLAAGTNSIELKAGDDVLKLTLTYKPQTNPYYVRLVWMTDNTGDTTFATPTDDVPQDYEARLRTAAQLMQTFTAERMHDLGFGRKTFRLERDDVGQIVVHTLKAPEPAQHYYKLGDSNNWWRDVYGWLNKEHPDPYAKNIVLAAYTRKDADTGKLKGHTALGGGNLGLFGSASVFCWPRDISTALDAFADDAKVDPTKVHEDSAGRGTYWGVASTTIGATLHEMGHTFGLPHCKDGLGIMTRGFDHFHRVFTFSDPPSGHNRSTKYFSEKEEAYFAPISASFLQWSRWFRLDQTEYTDDSRPRIKVDRNKQAVVVTAKAGVRWVGLWVGDEIYSYQEFKGDDAAREVEIPMDEVSKLLDGKTLSTVTAISANGQDGRIQANR